jgi:hypothetical protein
MSETITHNFDDGDLGVNVQFDNEDGPLVAIADATYNQGQQLTRIAEAFEDIAKTFRIMVTGDE